MPIQKITSNIISGLANTSITGNIISSQITSVANTQITGNIVASQITNVGNYAIVGTITSDQLANTGITAGIYGGASNAASITVDAQGRVTSVANVAWTSTSISGGFSNMQVFTANGTFTVPSGVTKVKVTIVGGGGGGSGFNAPSGCPETGYVGVAGTSGGTSSFGNMVSATGGGGSAIGVNGDLNLGGESGFAQQAGQLSRGGRTMFGAGGTNAGAAPTNGHYGGGGGSTYAPGPGPQGGATSGGTAIKIISGLTSAQTISVTIGAGGAGGSGTYNAGGAGARGLAIVEY